MNATILAVGRVLLGLAGIASVTLATRYLGVTQFGGFSTAIAFVTALAPITDVGLAAIAAREMAKHPEESDRLLGNVVALSLALTVAGALLGIALSQLLYAGPDDADVRRAIALMLLIGLPAAAPAAAASAYFIAHQQAWVGAVAGLCATLVTLPALVLTVTLDLGFYGVVLAYAGGGIGYAAAYVGFALARKARLRPRFDRGLSKRLFVWALPLGASTVVQALYLRVDVIVLSLVSTQANVGLFGLAFRVIDLVMVLPFFITVTLMPEFARLAESQRDRLDSLVQRALRLMQIVVVPLFACPIAFAPEITTLVGGDEFRAAADTLRILLLGAALTFMGGVLVQALIAVNLQRRVLLVTIVAFVVNASVAAALAPSLGPEGAAIGFAVAEVAAVSTAFAVYGRERRIPRLDARPAVLLATGAMIATALVKLPLAAFSPGRLFTLVVGCGLMLGVYTASLYALRAMPAEIHNGFVVPVTSRLRLALGGR